MNEVIVMEDWVGYFKGLLEGRVMRGMRGDRGEGDDEPKISREEVVRAVGKLKEGKVLGVDGIPGEVWKEEVWRGKVDELRIMQ